MFSNSLNKAWIIRNYVPVRSIIIPLIPKQHLSTSTKAASSEYENRTTIDKPNVDKFTELLNEWWDPTGPIVALHAMNKVRVPFVRDGLVPCAPNERKIMPLTDKKILDVGCGGGILSEGLSRLGAEVTGIDASEELIKLAQYHSKMNDELPVKPNFCFTTIEEHSKEFSNHYDGVIASEVIEHIVDKELFVKSCTAALKPGGRIFFTTPTKTRVCQVLGIWISEALNFIPKGTHQYELFTTPTELSFLLERNNCHVEIVHGLIYNPFSQKWTFSNSQKLLFALQAVKI